MSEPRKRKADRQGEQLARKKGANKKQWRASRQGKDAQATQARSIEPGDSGIWVTCNMKKEGKCVGELKDCFEEYVTKLYSTGTDSKEGDKSENEEELDIEAEIKRELHDLRNTAATATPYMHVRLDTSCVVFFKTLAPIEPVSFVHAICKDALASSERKRSRFIKKLTPMTLMGKATENGLSEVAQSVLAPHFHGDENAGKKFAIRPNLRNHTVLTRDTVIKLVASAVGPGHKVDLKDYDLLILVEVYKNICGISVVGNDYEQLKRYNLTEIYEPTPKTTEG